ncbi:hypothetical protein PS862_02748 [Pseudomonas fluorescens]|uniref:Uncharacterized protein n=1 Tax=Pseudomonas fluorescens TaxID=294 RepID=A0A5E7KI83_PSEFL|nr:hypothetical protein PS862_02748 [Pseudomonas fluorescens]
MEGRERTTRSALIATLAPPQIFILPLGQPATLAPRLSEPLILLVGNFAPALCSTDHSQFETKSPEISWTSASVGLLSFCATDLFLPFTAGVLG